MILLWLTACLFLNGTDVSTDPAPQASEEPAEPAASTVELPDDFRGCQQDTDCAVAEALAGLDHLPAPGERCKAECAIGVRRDAVPLWNAAVQERAAGVPCDLEMEPCPPLTAWTAQCVERVCVAQYAGN